MFLKDLYCKNNMKSRTISPENETGAKGSAAMQPSALGPSRKGKPFIKIEKSKEVEIANIEGPGIINHMWFTFPDINDNADFILRDTIIRIYWENSTKPAVQAPIGDFFLSGFGERSEVNSFLVSTVPNGGFNSYIQMPFLKNAKITIENKSSKDLDLFFYTINYCIEPDFEKEILYFNAYWNRQKTTELKKDYKLLPKISGSGKYIGTFLQLTALERYWWGEGEFKFYIDGDKDYPTITSTGAEDYFGGAWAFHSVDDNNKIVTKTFSNIYTGYSHYSTNDNSRKNFRLEGIQNHGFPDDGLPTHGLYRWHINDAINFQNELVVEFQQIGNDDIKLFERQDDIASVVYWYQDKPYNDLEPDFEYENRKPR